MPLGISGPGNAVPGEPATFSVQIDQPFRARHPNGNQAGGVYQWFWYPNDTLPQPQAISPTSIDACFDQPTCTYTPPGKGRVGAVVYVERYGMAARSEPINSTPRLACTPSTVVRGGNVSCTAYGAGVSVETWTFEKAGGGYNLGTPLNSIGSTWSGKMAVSGQVTANIAVGGASSGSLTADITVTPRPSQWPRFHTREGPEATAPAANVVAGVLLGLNCPEINGSAACDDYSILLPDPRQSPTAGFTVEAISSGPNMGLWYVASTDVQVRRVTNINPAMLPNSNLRNPLTPAQQSECQTALSLPSPPLELNFYEINTCKGLDVDEYIAALRGHEDAGYNGGIGHNTLIREAMADPVNDPYAALDSLIGLSDSELTLAANDILRAIQVRIYNHTADHSTSNPGGPRGNWPNDPVAWASGTWPSGLIYVWNANLGRYSIFPDTGF